MPTHHHPSYPLTKQQEGLWVEWRLHPDNTSYNTCVNLRLKGELDEARFEQALHDVVRFFTSLRIYFTEENGIPHQRVSDDVTFRMEYEDISLPDIIDETPELQSKGREFLARKVATPVDLKTFPIVHAGLLKVTHDTYYFIGLVPHIISDGVSAVLFLESTSIAYNEGYEGLERAYGENEKTWDDYFALMTASDQKTDAQASADYWQSRLAGAQHTIAFNQDAQAQQGKTGERVYFNIGADLSKQLKDFSRANRTTFFSVLAATFALLMNRYYRQEDITIGYPVNIRPSGYKHFFGFFVNIIPLRVDSSGDPTFSELIARVSDGRKKDKKHQAFPALDIVRQIRKEQPDFDGRVFNVSMAQTVSRLVNLQLDGMISEPLEVTYNDVNDDLSLSYEILEDGQIGLWFEYRQSLFEPEFIQQMIAHMRFLFEQIIAAPQQHLSAFSLLNEQEEQALVTRSSQTETSHHIATCVHTLFEQTAHTHADTTALIEQSKPISYAQLNARANQLAHYLKAQGVNTGDRIAFCLPRGASIIETTLGIMKAGAAYVPLSPDYPKDRIDYIVNDAGCRMIITHTDYAVQCNAAECITIDTLDLDNQPIMNLPQTASHHDAYIIYTSGSTGKPKGVRITHDNVLPRLAWLQDTIPLGTDDIVLQNTDITFDVSVAEIFWPLANSAALALTEQAEYKDPSYLIALIEQHQVTATCFVPSLLNSVLAVLKDGRLDSIKHLLAAGEALPPTLVKRFYERSNGTLYNVYGPTEGTIYSAYHICSRDDDNAIIPIGTPLSNTTLYILDQHSRPVPDGISGELHIGCAGVAHGYVNLPDITAERFIADQFSDNADARLYKTGDLARYNAHGEIEYLGRIDSQVKIRGFRIELAEIESVLSLHEKIQDVAVIDYETNGHKRLAAYYVADAEHDLAAIKKQVCDALPPYMSPAFYVHVATIPRLTSGKINRHALPKPEATISKRKAYQAPQNARETELVALWSDILKIPQDSISTQDSFFEIGGDSLMAIQFVCAAEERGILFDTNSLFTHKTIADLAAIAKEGRSASAPQEAINATYPLLPRQAKFFADNFAQPHHWNRFFFFEIDHDANLEMLKNAFDTVLTHHDNLRVRFIQDDNGTWQQQCAGTLPNAAYVHHYDISHLPIIAQQDAIISESNHQQTSMSLDTAPLIRILHFKTGEASGKLAIIAHHLLLDIVSSRIIFEDFLTAYEGLRHSLPMPLAAKTTSVHDVTNTQSNAQDFTDALAYWSNSRMQPTPVLPYDTSQSNATEATAKQQVITLDAHYTAALLQHIPQTHQLMIQDILLAALHRTTQSWTGENDLLVNICGHGRTGHQGQNLSRTVGWLNTVFPVHLSTANTDVFHHAKDIKAQLEAVPARNEHYNLLRYTLQHPDITKDDTPEIFFNYVSQIDALLPEGLSIIPQETPKGIQSSHPDNHLCYALYMEAAILNKQCQLYVTYSDALFTNETITNFIDNYKSHIQMIIDALYSDHAVMEIDVLANNQTDNYLSA